MIALFLVLLLCLSARGYNSEYLFTRAESGPKTLYEHEKLLRDALGQNPWNNEVSLRTAQVLQVESKWAEARSALKWADAAADHWQGWELEASALEHEAFLSSGTIEDAYRAANLFDNILRVNPTYKSGIERRGLLGLKLGEWETVSSLASKLTELDANSPNAKFLRAQVAEASGDWEVARNLYGQLSASADFSKTTWYTRDDIHNRLKRLIGSRRL